MTASCSVGPFLDRPTRYSGASMWTNGRGTNSVMPPVLCCNSLQDNSIHHHEHNTTAMHI